MTGKFVDIHNHLLWGLDDGPRRSAETAAMIQAAIGDGIGTVVATPHITPGIEPFDKELYDERLLEARRYCVQNGSGLFIFGGSELLYTPYTVPMLRDGRIPTLNNTDYVLIEFGNDVHWADMTAAVEALIRAGYTPIIAHVERYDCVLLLPGRAAAFRGDNDVRYQINCNTVLNPRGLFTKRLVRKLFDSGAVDAIATDSHNTSTRPSNMRKAYISVSVQYGREYADRVTEFPIK